MRQFADSVIETTLVDIPLDGADQAPPLEGTLVRVPDAADFAVFHLRQTGGDGCGVRAYGRPTKKTSGVASEGSWVPLESFSPGATVREGATTYISTDSGQSTLMLVPAAGMVEIGLVFYDAIGGAVDGTFDVTGYAANVSEAQVAILRGIGDVAEAEAAASAPLTIVRTLSQTSGDVWRLQLAAFEDGVAVTGDDAIVFLVILVATGPGDTVLQTAYSLAATSGGSAEVMPVHSTDSMYLVGVNPATGIADVSMTDEEGGTGAEIIAMVFLQSSGSPARTVAAGSSASTHVMQLS